MGELLQGGVISGGEVAGKDRPGRALASCSVQVGWEPSPEPTVSLHITPSTLIAPGGTLADTDVSVCLYVNGTPTAPDSVWISSDINELNLEGDVVTNVNGAPCVRLWGVALESGMVEIGARLGDSLYFGNVQLVCMTEPPVGYELFCLNPVVSFDAEGKASQSTVSVTPFLLTGTTRTPLPVNTEEGAEHYCFRRRSSLTDPAASDRSTTFGSGLLKGCTWARFDLVPKERVTVVSGGRGFTYDDDDVVASQEIVITRDGLDGTGAAFTSIVFKRAETKPAAPEGGTYSNPVPPTGGWSDAPDSGTDPLWMSRARFAPDTVSPAWSDPAPVQDAAGIEFLYNPNEEYGSAPFDTHPHDTGEFGWCKTAADAVWMAVSVMNNGVWSKWQIVRIKGERGESGRSIWSGPVREWDSYTDGYRFSAGDVESTDGTFRKDFVIHGEDSQSGLPIAWTCEKGHTKVSVSEPGKDPVHEPGKEEGLPEQYWRKGLVFETVSTRMVMAKEGHIDLMHSQGIRIYDDAGGVRGQMSSMQKEPPAIGGRKFPFFIGGLWDTERKVFEENPLFAVDSSGNTYHGGVSGRHIEIRSQDKEINIFDEGGKLVAAYNGRPLAVADVLKSSSGSSGFTGIVWRSSPYTGESSFSIDVASGTVDGNGRMEITVPELKFQGSAKSKTGEGLQGAPAVIVSLVVKVGGVEWVHDQLMYEGDVSTGGVININSSSAPRSYNIDMANGAVYTVELRVQLVSATHASITVSGEKKITGVYTSPEYREEHGSNGFYLKRDNQNYVYFIFDDAGTLHCRCVAGGVTVFESN